MKYFIILSLVLLSTSIFAGVREQKITAEGIVLSYDADQIVLGVGKKKTTIPRLKEFERKLRFTGKQTFVIDTKKYSDFLEKNRKDK